MDVLDQLEESVAQVAASRENGERDPELECRSPALAGLFEDALKGTVNTDGSRASLAQELTQYLTVDLYRAMATKMIAIDADFDRFDGIQNVDQAALVAANGVFSDDRFRIPTGEFARVPTVNVLGRDPQVTLGQWATDSHVNFQTYVFDRGVNFDDENDVLVDAMKGVVVPADPHDVDDQGMLYYMRPPIDDDEHLQRV